jgi:hypothetical protein
LGKAAEPTKENTANALESRICFGNYSVHGKEGHSHMHEKYID